MEENVEISNLQTGNALWEKLESLGLGIEARENWGYRLFQVVDYNKDEILFERQSFHDLFEVMKKDDKFKQEKQLTLEEIEAWQKSFSENTENKDIIEQQNKKLPLSKQYDSFEDFVEKNYPDQIDDEGIAYVPNEFLQGLSGFEWKVDDNEIVEAFKNVTTREEFENHLVNLAEEYQKSAKERAADESRLLDEWEEQQIQLAEEIGIAEAVSQMNEEDKHSTPDVDVL